MPTYELREPIFPILQETRCYAINGILDRVDGVLHHTRSYQVLLRLADIEAEIGQDSFTHLRDGQPLRQTSEQPLPEITKIRPPKRPRHIKPYGDLPVDISFQHPHEHLESDPASIDQLDSCQRNFLVMFEVLPTEAHVNVEFVSVMCIVESYEITALFSVTSKAFCKDESILAFSGHPACFYGGGVRQLHEDRFCHAVPDSFAFPGQVAATVDLEM